jgi:hypothetical protein
MIAKSASQYFQRRKRLVKRSYGSKVISGQSSGQPSPVSRDESASVLLTSASVRMTSASIQPTWKAQRVTCVMMMSACHVAAPEAATCHSNLAFQGTTWTSEKCATWHPQVMPRGTTQKVPRVQDDMEVIQEVMTSCTGGQIRGCHMAQ